jgi:hypothetical protein
MSKHNLIGGQFSARTIKMLVSPAYRVLSLAAHRVLDRIEIEHANHGGKDNGRLPVTFDQFVEYGIHRHAIAPAIRELIALGFIEITRQGSAGNAEWRRPNLFRLTYRQSFDLKPTNEWLKVTNADANTLANGARRAPPKNISPVPVSAKSQCRKPSLKPVPETVTENQKTPRNLQCRKPSLPLDTLHLVGGWGPQGQQPPEPPDPDPEAGLDIPEFLRRGSQ